MSPAAAAPPTAETAKPPRKLKTTPLPMRQLVPMTFVLLNESLCGTTLLPFIGLFVAHLQNRPAEEAGYVSGVLIGFFMLGQVVSARMWGWLSDQYGRRFPLISGLFTSGVMILFFGLSTSVWMCAISRFMQGLFNGNILVAKTMMADITDKTNQAKGFSFVSFVGAIGTLIGPAMGGLLYDPANSDTFAWLGLDKEGIFATHPALLPSLIIFCYTNVGMVVCTLFVQETNPKAKPLPSFLKMLYPCLWRPAKQFVLPPLQYEDEEEAETLSQGSADGDDEHTPTVSRKQRDRSARYHQGGHASPSSASTTAGGVTVVQMKSSIAVDVMGAMSPVATEDNRDYDTLIAQERVPTNQSAGSFGTSGTTVMATASTREGQAASITQPAVEITPLSPSAVSAAEGKSLGSSSNSSHGAHVTVADTAKEDNATASSSSEGSEARREKQRVEDGDAAAARDGEKGEKEEEEAAPGEIIVVVAEEKRESFGYKQAFGRPITRFMLITYMILCASDMTMKECFPLWAISSTDVGGLGFRADKVGFILLTNSAPLFVSNFLFHKACGRYVNKMGLFRVGTFCAAVAVACVSLTSYLHLGVFTFILVLICTSVRQFFVTWCYSLITMLTARSAPPGHIGTIMGINQSCGASTRAMVPFIAAPLYAWSISGNHIFPFNHCLIFILSSLSFCYCWWRSYQIRTDADTKLEFVENEDGDGGCDGCCDKVAQAFRRCCGARDNSSSSS